MWLISTTQNANSCGDDSGESKHHSVVSYYFCKQLLSIKKRFINKSDSDSGDPELQPGTQLTEQPDRGRRKGRRSGSEQQKYREQEMLRQYQHKWYRLSLQPVWTKHTLSTETQTMVTQCSALESQLRDLVRGDGTVAERMVKAFRAALHSFRVLARGHALQSVQSAIRRQLNGGRHSNSVTREYCSGTTHNQRGGLTDYCMC